MTVDIQLKYRTREVAKLLGIPLRQVYSLVRAGSLDPQRGDRGQLLFSFQQLVLLRTAKGLRDARIPPRRIRNALSNLRDQLPEDRPLTSVQVLAEGDRIVVRHNSERWNPESGQLLFDFQVSQLAGAVPIPDRPGNDPEPVLGPDRTAEDWYQQACELEAARPEEAVQAYRRALELDPSHLDAQLNLGRLRHDQGRFEEAEVCYRAALEGDPLHSIATYNLGVALEDLQRYSEAISAYEKAVFLDPGLKEAHFNLARIYETLKRPDAAFRHLKTYKQLSRK